MKKNLRFTILILYVSMIAMNSNAQQRLIVNPAAEEYTHDIHLSPWGPYSKRYAGISHIAAMQSGMRFDFTVCPGYYRNKILVPNVLFESGYTPWKVSPDMKRVTYRYQLEWKDQVYTVVTYYTLDSSRVLVEMNCVNNTSVIQNLTLNSLAFIDYPVDYPLVKAIGADSMQWVNAVDYKQLNLVTRSPRYFLTPDGQKRNEIRSDSALDGSLLAKEFGKETNDEAVYELSQLPTEGTGTMFFRYKVQKGATARFQLSGICNQKIDFEGSGQFEWKQLACNFSNDNKLILRSAGTTELVLDGFFMSKIPGAAAPQIVPQGKYHNPITTRDGEAKNLLLKYRDINTYYGMAWNYANDDVREVLNDDLDVFFKLVANNNVTKSFVGNKKGHYTNLFFRPIEVKPHESRKLYVLLAAGSEAYVQKQVKAFDVNQLLAELPKLAPEEPVLPGGKPYQFGNQLLQAALLSNVVYPIYTQRQYIRHFTPGKWWNSLYTWDDGFIALGMQEVDIQKSFEIINAYTTEVGNQSAFIHHGSPVPVQFSAYYDLWNRTQSKNMLAYLYPRLKQYYEFMIGLTPTSTTRMASGLLKTWDYFYNSGGWDDYAPQKYLRDNPANRPNITPVITTAQCIRAAKIMRLAASELGLEDELHQYDQQVASMDAALQKYSWDETTGYYSYVVHDTKGNAEKIFRYPPDNSNFNMGLDGVSPLVSGIASKEQQQKMMANLFSPKHLWTPYGLTAVDQSAAYFTQDGYWNGTVWMPHQWFMWKAMLDMGEGDKAWQIAHTALELWKRETGLTYNTYEHFISSSGRGAGWSQFSGLSSPVLNWFAAYFKPGTVTTGFEVWIAKQAFGNDHSSYKASLKFDQTSKHQRCMLVCLNPANKYNAYFNNVKCKTVSYHPGFIQIYLPDTDKGGELKVVAADLAASKKSK
jgi:hypothetical protein